MRGPVFLPDIEEARFQEERRRRSKIIPSRKRWLCSHPARSLTWIMTAIACITTAVCIFQSVWLKQFKDGTRRVANDPFDNVFSSYDQIHDQTSPKIWDSSRQSFIHNALPIPVHSHNDEWRRIPLFEALGSGCISVEADVHLRKSDLLVAHSATGLRSKLTLRSMYLEPLQRMIEAQNINSTNGTWRGIFNRTPQQTIVLLVDHKSDGAETFAELYRQLQPLRDLDYLTYWDGTQKVVRPLTVVATGNAPFESVIALNETHRDIFWDAPLQSLHSTKDDFDTDPPTFFYNSSNSHYASAQWMWINYHRGNRDGVPPYWKDLEDSNVERAQSRGLISRYWDVPSSSPNEIDLVLRVLLAQNVGVLNMDDMGLARARARGLGKLPGGD